MSRHLSWLEHTGTTETIVVLNNSVLHWLVLSSCLKTGLQMLLQVTCTQLPLV